MNTIRTTTFITYLIFGLSLWGVMMAAYDLFFVWVDHWLSALVMVFGSFIAGSTPLGGGAVAFPVFSKFFGVAAFEAKTFSLFIQSVGMTSATVYFLLSKVYINWRLIAFLMPSTLVGFVFGMSGGIVLDGAVKMVFSAFALLCGMLLLLLYLKGEQLERPLSHHTLTLVGFGCGLLAALLGTGADALLFFTLAIVYRQKTVRIIPTTVTYMAVTSIFGSLFVLLQSPELVTPFVINSWLVAAPVVFVFAPLGGLVMTRVNPRLLLIFIKSVLIVEAGSTLLFTQLSMLQTLLLLALLLLALGYFLKNVKSVLAQ